MHYLEELTGLSNLSNGYSFEENFDVHSAKRWFSESWHYSIYYSALYVLAIWAGQRYMASRPAYDLRLPMAAWSAVLAVFSWCGAVRIVPYIPIVLRHLDLHFLICDNRFFYVAPTGFWAYLFTLSKVYELGDTFFIVARKQKLVFLHWYHHITVMIYCWHGYPLDSPTGAIFGCMNYSVHAVMYSYYALKALRFYIPKQVNMLITLLQLTQMVVGVGVTVMTLHYRHHNIACAEKDRTIYLAMAMYSSYMVLFMNFFYQTYLRPRPIRKHLDVNGNGLVSGKHQHHNGKTNGKHE